MSTESYRVSSYVEAAKIFDGYVGSPMGTTLQKIYMGHGQFGATPPAKVAQLAAAGCQFVISIEPDRNMTGTEQHVLANWLTMLNNAGIVYRVVLYAECNNVAFKTVGDWLPYWSYYAPVVQQAGVLCGYDPGCGPTAIGRAQAYFPSSPAPDELWMDYYATSFRGGSRLDKLIAMADAAGIPAGLAEWGWAAGVTTFSPMTMPWWNDYGAYIMNLAGQGHLRLGASYFDAVANGTRFDIVASRNDPRIPLIQKMGQAIRTAP